MRAESGEYGYGDSESGDWGIGDQAIDPVQRFSDLRTATQAKLQKITGSRSQNAPDAQNGL